MRHLNALQFQIMSLCVCYCVVECEPFKWFTSSNNEKPLSRLPLGTLASCFSRNTLEGQNLMSVFQDFFHVELIKCQWLHNKG